jgi:hypothetical protein
MADEKDIKNEISQQEKITNLQKVRADFIKNELEAQEKLTKLKNKYVSELDLEIQRRKTVAELDEEYVDVLMATNESLEAQLATRIKDLEVAKDKKTISAQQEKADKEKIAHLEAMAALTKEQREGLAKEYAERVKINKEFEKTVGHATGFGKRMTGLLGLGIDFGDTFIGGLANSGKLMLDLTAKSGNLGKVMSSKLMAMGPQLLGLVATRTEELLTATDGMISGFVKATGANQEFRDSLVDGMNAARGMGLSIQNAGVATQALFESTVSFRRASEQGRESMILFTSTLEQAGVSSQATAKNIQILSKTLNIAGEDAAKEASKMVTLAQSIGRPISQVSSDFAEAAGTISAHGDNMMQVFSELSAAAEATGLSMGNLLGIAAQFDTFDSAASAVGRLNSIMGGPYLNSIEMVYMSESERIRAMLEATEMSGASWESMGRLEKRAFAAAAGISDMTQANELFSGGLAAYDDAQAKADLNAASQEKLAELAKQSTTMFENLANSLNGIAVSIAPVINLLRGMIDSLTWILNLGSSFMPMGAGLVSWAITLGGALKGLKFTMGLYTTSLWSNIGAHAKSIAMLGLKAAKLIFINPLLFASAVATGAYTAAMGLANLATAAFGAVFGATLGPILLGIAALGVAILLIVTYWDEIQVAFASAFDFIAGKFSDLGAFVKNMFTDVGTFLLGLVDLWFLPIRLLINSVLGAINLVAGAVGSDMKLKLIPTVTEMAGMQEGGTLTQGSAIVGEPEGGPELLTNTPAGPKITPLPGGGKGANSGANLVAALQENTATMKAMMAATGAAAGGDKPAQFNINVGTRQLKLAATILNGAINNLPEKDIALRYDLGGGL